MTDCQVIRRPDDDRFALTQDGDDIGFVAYRQTGDVITLTHTEIDPDIQEHGLGSMLVRGTLDAIRDGSSDRVVAQCPFVAAWIGKHPDYAELLER